MRTHGGVLGLIATVAAAGCLFAGFALVAVSLAPRHPAAGMPPLSVAPQSIAPQSVAPQSVGIPPTQARTQAPTLASSKPVRLTIPSIGVDSVLQHLGQDAAGGLEVPAPGPRYDQAAWYRYSPTPGALGPAVLLGHVDSAADGPSVFFRLGELRPGERMAVARADGSTAVFTVDAVHRYPKDDFPTELVYGDIDHAGLRVLTCGGAFDHSTRSYVDNVVVFASLVRDAGPAVSTRLR